MSKTIKEERLRWILPIINKEMRLVDISKICPYSKRSLERWCRGYIQGGEKSLIPKTTIPKTSPGETSISIKEAVIKKRKETKLCAQKIHWRLKKQGLDIPVRTIGKIIKDEGLTRKYRIKKVRYKYIRATRQPGELIEIDVKYVPGRIKGRRYYQYTAIDVASRWRYLRVFDEQSNYHSVVFLKDVVSRFKYKVESVKTDNGAIFTNRYNGTYKREDLSPRKLHAFDVCCAKHNIVHYLIDPGKPAQNGTVERSHREDQEKFYERNIFRNIKDLQRKMQLWNDGYNNLEHCGLNGKTPLEFLSDYELNKVRNIKLVKLKKPTKVLA
jgi:transposase InsO family protein